MHRAIYLHAFLTNSSVIPIYLHNRSSICPLRFCSGFSHGIASRSSYVLADSELSVPALRFFLYTSTSGHVNTQLICDLSDSHERPLLGPAKIRVIARSDP